MADIMIAPVTSTCGWRRDTTPAGNRHEYGKAREIRTSHVAIMMTEAGVLDCRVS